MKPLTRLLIVTVFCAAGVTLGQQPKEENPHRPRTINRNNWVGKRVLTKEFMKQVGIQNAQAEKLKADLEAIHAKSQKLEESINRDALQQAEVAKKVLSEPGANTDELMDIIERIGRSRTEQAKLATRQLIIIRDSLTAEQRAKAKDIFAAEGKRRMEIRAAERAARELREKQALPATALDPTAPKN